MASAGITHSDGITPADEMDPPCRPLGAKALNGPGVQLPSSRRPRSGNLGTVEVAGVIGRK